MVDARPSVVFPVTSNVPATEVFVVDAFVAVNEVTVVVARVEVPVTASVPCDVRELVKIPSVALRSAVKNEPVDVALVNDAETAERSDVKKLDEVLFVRVAFVAKRLVAVAFVVLLFVA